jgi:hypothetical protein
MVIAALVKILDLGGGQAENVEVVFTDFLEDFDVGAVQGADCQRTVHRELHVAGSEAFVPAVEICSLRSAAATSLWFS